MRIPTHLWSTVTVGLLVLCDGCHLADMKETSRRIELSQQLAEEMYDARTDDDSPPAPFYANRVRNFGRDNFVGWLAMRKISHHGVRNLHKMIYALGWFGDLWHLDLIAGWLKHERPEVRENALAAFCRITGQRFDSPDSALEWWYQHATAYPRYDRDVVEGRKKAS